MRFRDTQPESLAEAIIEQLEAPTDYLPIDPTAARRAAGLTAELL